MVPCPNVRTNDVLVKSMLNKSGGNGKWTLSSFLIPPDFQQHVKDTTTNKRLCSTYDSYGYGKSDIVELVCYRTLFGSKQNNQDVGVKCELHSNRPTTRKGLLR